jgi:hypothetical protein
MIEKPSIIITSLGRTGTLFLQKLFDASILDGTCLHEPDRLNFGQYKGIRNKISQIYRQINESGASNILVRKFFLSDWSIDAISKNRIIGKLSSQEARQRIISQRKKFIHGQPGSLYVESSSAFYGVIDLLEDVFTQHRMIYIVRDGRDWVRSKMNFGTMYNKSRLQRLISVSWPTAVELNDSIYEKKWHGMTRFEKICWAWTTFNQYALKCSAKNPYARIFRFEDLIKSPRAGQNLSSLMDFVTDLVPSMKVKKDGLDEWLNQKTHSSQKLFPAWEQWSNEQIIFFIRICGPLMEKMGYGLND